MRSLLVLALMMPSLAGCGDGGVRITKREETTQAGAPLRVVETLNCPQHQGDLTRTATSADGLSCTYSGPRGSEVTLRLVRLAEGQAFGAALSPIEAELRALMPHTVERASADGGDGVVSVQSSDNTTRVRLPGVSVDADSERASINIGGIRIEGDNDGGGASDGDESVVINANDNAAEIRTASTSNAIRASYILVDEEPSEAGWRVVGYEARGPNGGPLVVAVVHSKDRREEAVFDAAKELVSLNVGGSL